MNPRNDNDNDTAWASYRLLILDFKQETDKRLSHIEDRLEELNMNVSNFKLTGKFVSGIIGFVASLVPILANHFLK